MNFTAILPVAKKQNELNCLPFNGCFPAEPGLSGSLRFLTPLVPDENVCGTVFYRPDVLSVTEGNKQN